MKRYFISAFACIVFHASAGIIIISPQSVGTMIGLSASDGTTDKTGFPYEESFESYADDSWIYFDFDFWQAAPGDASRIWLHNYSYNAARPINTLHSKVLILETEGNTLYCSVTGRSDQVWIEMMVYITPLEDEPWIEDWTAGLALYMNATSNLCAYARTGAFEQPRLIISSTVLDPFIWYRLAMHLVYQEAPGECFFSVSIDNVPVEWPDGTSQPMTLPTSGYGPWLRFANPPTDKFFPGLAFEGTGAIDDLVIDDHPCEPDDGVRANLAPGYAISWRSDNGRSYEVEYCTNLASHAWQTLQSGILGNGVTNTIYDSEHNSKSRFYRVVPLNH